MIEANVLHPSELAAEDVAAWRDWQARTPAFGNPLLGPDFACAVGGVRDDARVALFRLAGKLVGLLPLHRRPGGLARPIGAPFSDYHALITAPDAPVRGGEALAAAGFSAFRFSGLLDPHGVFDLGGTGESEAFSIVLDGDPDAYFEDLRAASAKRFKNWRRLEHKLEREHGEIRLEAPDVSSAAFEQLLTWKREQLHRTGAHDFLRPEWTDGLMRSLFEDRDGDFQGLMITLHAGDTLIAGHFGVRLGDWYHPWIASTDPAFAPWSPGQIFLSRVIRVMPALGLRIYDMGPGHDHYKRHYGRERTALAEGQILAAGSAGRVAGSIEGAWALAGADRKPIVGRVRRRLEQIATLELTLGGRVRGVFDAIAGHGRREASRRDPEAP